MKVADAGHHSMDSKRFSIAASNVSPDQLAMLNVIYSDRVYNY